MPSQAEVQASRRSRQKYEQERRRRASLEGASAARARAQERQLLQAQRDRKTRMAAVSNVWSGKCVAVSDGDTIQVLKDGRAVKIRLYGIDSPEKAQPFGQKAKQFTSRLVFGKTVKVYPKGLDRYQRVLAWVFVGQKCVNRELVSNGLAWWYKQYSPNESGLAQLEQKARSRRFGLWGGGVPVAPWDWRKRRA